MQYCKRCKITDRNPHRKCPLCQGNLEGIPEEENQMFPDFTRENSRMAMGFHSFWSGYVLAGVGCMWILSAVAIVKRRNLFKNAVWEAVLLWAVFLFWDFITGWRGWSVDFGIPIVLLAVYVILWVVVFVTRAPVSHYMIYMVIVSVGSLIPLILLLCGAVGVRLPSVLCVAGAVLMLSALAIFKGRALGEELRKKTHL